MGTTIKSLKQTKTGVTVTFSNGKKETFDIVVGADGINSQVRNYVQPKAKKDYTGSTFWGFWAPTNVKRPKYITNYLGNGKFLGVFPSKHKKHLTLLFCIPAKARSFRESKTNAQFLQEKFSDMGGIIPSILSHLPKNPDKILHRDDYETHIDKWHKGRIVLLGDAVHALSPIAGMGASMAMEDAHVLGEELVRDNDVEKAFERYVTRRKPRVQTLAKWSRQAHKLMTVRTPFYTLRNLFIKYFYKILFYRQMVKFLGERA